MLPKPAVEPDLALASVAITARRTTSPGLRGVGFRTQAARFENLDEGGQPRIAEEFVIASRTRRWDRAALLSIGAYFTDDVTVTRSMIDREPVDDPITLPDGVPIHASLGDCIARRRSVRDFTGRPVAVADFGDLLSHTASVTAVADTDLIAGGTVPIPLRAAPSAGGLYPVETWLAVLINGDLGRGVYRYLPDRHALALWRGPQAVDELLGSFDAEESGIDIGRAAAMVLFVGRPWRSMRKYGPRGLRFTLHEAGGLAQNLLLALAGLGLGGVDFSGYYDDEANDALGLDGLHEFVAHTVVVGHTD